MNAQLPTERAEPLLWWPLHYLNHEKSACLNHFVVAQYWERSKRLTFGAMVCFLVAQGPSSEIIFATVASRDTDAPCFPDRRSASFLWTLRMANRKCCDCHRRTCVVCREAPSHRDDLYGIG